MGAERETRQMWARLAVDPLADPLARRLAPYRAVTPNRITAAALLMGLAAAGCFAAGQLRVAGALVLVRYFTDCLDGKVARLQGTSSARGALFDITSDVVCISLVAATLSWRLWYDGHLAPATALALLTALVVYNWALDHRKWLAGAAGIGTGGAAHAWQPSLPLVRGWVRWCRSIDMAVAPWVLEVEMGAFGIAPLVLPESSLPVVLAVATGCYVLAALVNVRRAWRIAGPRPAAADAPVQAPLEHAEAVGARRGAWPSVDVVVATRDRPELLALALTGIWNQDYPGHVTIHVVFDQTAPEKGLEGRSGNREARVLTNLRTPGLAGARNSGILAGSGDLVAFCDDDDSWEPAKLRLQVDRLLEAGADTAVTGIVVQYADHAVERVPRADDLALERLVRNRVMEAHPSTVLVRRAALEGPIGLVDEAIPGSYGEDFDWIIRAARHGRIAVAAQPLVRVRWGQSMFSRNWQTIVDAIDYGLVKTPEFRADPLALGRLYGRRAFALAALGRREALPAAVRTLRVSPREKRAYLAAAVALHLVSAERLLDLAHRRGHGI